VNAVPDDRASSSLAREWRLISPYLHDQGAKPGPAGGEELSHPDLEPLLAPFPPSARRLLAAAPAHGSRPRRPRSHRNLESEDVADQHKRIVICADGTWNAPQQAARGGPAPTNVSLLWRMVNDRTASNLPQLAYYHPGVGTGGLFDRVVGGINGWGLRRNILECYRFLVEQYRPGDYLYLFGFSRGAYTVRSLAGLIRNSGIIRRDQFPPPGEAREAAIAAMDAASR